MNKKGFTLIEILAVIIIIGIVSTITIMSVTDNVYKSKDETFVNLAKNYAESARSMRAKEGFYYDPKNGEAIIIPYDKIDGTEIENNTETGYGKIIPSYSYVTVLNKSNNYYYYVTQVDKTYHIIDRVDYNKLTKKDMFDGQDELESKNVKELEAPFVGFQITYNNETYSIKGLRVSYEATIKAEGITNINTKKLKGSLKVESDRVTLTVDGSTYGEIKRGEYVLSTKDDVSGYTGVWSRFDSDIRVAIKTSNSNEVVFDLFVADELLAENIKTTKLATLYGYYTSDSSYLYNSSQSRGYLNIFDSYKTVGKFPTDSSTGTYFDSTTQENIVVYNGIPYSVKNAELLYILIKKN